MNHDHVGIAVVDADPPGTEDVPARWRGENEWELLRSPLCAVGVASDDGIRVVATETGAFEVVHRGGNVCVQLYLDESIADDADATATAAGVVATPVERFAG